MQGDDAQGFVTPPSVQDQAPGLDAPADTQPHPGLCLICGRIFRRRQDRNRHLRTFLPHWIHCPFPRCPYRCDRGDALALHWSKQHENSGQQAPRQQQYQIYDVDALVTLVVNRQMSMGFAIDTALSNVERRAQELDKEDAWERNWWGRRTLIISTG